MPEIKSDRAHGASVSATFKEHTHDIAITKDTHSDYTDQSIASDTIDIMQHTLQHIDTLFTTFGQCLDRIS